MATGAVLHQSSLLGTRFTKTPAVCDVPVVRPAAYAHSLAAVAVTPLPAPPFLVQSGSMEELSHEKDYQGKGVAGVSPGVSFR
jgi:hypothetical protein